MSEAVVSIILAVRNEERFIARTLDAVLHQEYPLEAMEILVADGASDDGTTDAIRALDVAGRIRIIPNPRRIQAAGLNLAMQHAHGDIIVRVDGHTVIAPDYVRQCVALLHQTGAWNVGGCMHPIGLTPMGRAIAAAGTTVFAVPSAFHVSSTAQYTDTVYMGAWPRTVLLALGGFDEHLRTNEDYELNYRIRRAGGRIYLSPALRSSYICRQTLPTLARQYLSYGVGKADTMRKYPASLRPRQLVAPAFVAILVSSLAFWLISPVTRVLLLTALLSYCLLSVAFSLSAVWLRRPAYVLGLLWRLPLIYLTIHLCWGTGFWFGLLSSAVRRRDRAHEGAPGSTRGNAGGSGEWRLVMQETVRIEAGVEERHGS